MAKFQSPIDFKAILDEAMDLNKAKGTSVSVSVYIDDSAADDVIAFTRNAYASAAANARISIAYLSNADFIINEADDFAVIVAGRDIRVGARAEELRLAGIPAMIVTTSPNLVEKVAKEQEHPIPNGDIVNPEVLTVQDSEAAEILASLPINAGADQHPVYEQDDEQDDEASAHQDGVMVDIEEVLETPKSDPTRVEVDGRDGAAAAGEGSAAAGADGAATAGEAAEGVEAAAGADGAATAGEEPADGDAAEAAGEDAVGTTANADADADTDTDAQDEVTGTLRTTGPARGGLFSSLVSKASATAGKLRRTAAAAVASATEVEEPVNPFLADVPEGLDADCPMNEENTRLMSVRMGKWVIATCKDKALPLSLAFPFVRRPYANEIVNVTSVQNAGIGAVLFIPGADMPIMTLNQAKMLLQIAAAYGQPMTFERAKELAAVVAGGFSCRSLARQVVGILPAGGWVAKGVIGYTGTLAMGKAAIEYFESGAGLVGVAGLTSKLTGAVQKAVSQAMGEPAEEEEPEEKDPMERVIEAAQRATKFAGAASATVAPMAQTVAKTAVSSFADGANSILSSLSGSRRQSK